MNVQDELLSEIKSGISDGSILIERETDEYIEKMSRAFPFSGSKIDWDKLPAHSEQFAPPEKFVELAYLFFCKQSEIHNLKGKIFVLSDSAFDVVLLMSLETARHYLRTLLEVPQHLYLVSEDLSWCMAFTMEGYFDFGFCPDAD